MLIWPWVLIMALIISIAAIFILFKEEKKTYKTHIDGKVETYWQGENKRSCVRKDYEVNVRYRFIPSGKMIRPEKQAEAKSKNISKKGIGLLIYEKLEQGFPLKMEIDVPDCNKPVKAEGRVAWCKEVPEHDEKGRRLFNIGVEFVSIEKACNKSFFDIMKKIGC